MGIGKEKERRKEISEIENVKGNETAEIGMRKEIGGIEKKGEGNK